MRTLSSPLLRQLGLAWVLLTLPALSAVAQSPSGSELLQELRIRDNLLLSALTLDVEITTPADFFHPENGDEVRRGTMSTDGSTVALHTRSHYPAPALFREAISDRDRSRNYDENGALIVWRNVEKMSYSSWDFNESRSSYRVQRVTEAGYAFKEAATHDKRLLYDIGDSNNINEYLFSLLALGRGYASLLVEAESVTRNDEGLLEVTSKGHFGPTSSGRWQLLVDPGADYLIRDALYFAEGRVTPSVVAKASGRAAGERALAGHGLLRFFLDRAGTYDFAVTLHEQRQETDFLLMSNLQASLTDLSTSSLPIHDLRSQPVLGAKDLLGDDDEVDPYPIDTCCVCRKIVNYKYAECGHFDPPDPNPCASEWCIENVENTATCRLTGTEGQNRCNIIIPYPTPPSVMQTVKLIPGGGCPTAGRRVVWRIELNLADGCHDCVLWPPHRIASACNIAACNGVALPPIPKGEARDCA